MPLMLAPTFLIPMLGADDAATAERSPELAAVVETLTGVVTVLSWVLAGVFLVGGIGYWFVCRHAHAVWRSLPVEEREELTRQRVEGLRQAIVALGGVDPEGLPLRAEDLDEVSDRHRRILEDLQAKAKETSAPICAGARARTGDLVMAARLHRALSRDTIVRPPHAASSASDPRVLALVELDEQLQAEAAGLAEAVDTGRCNCDRDTHDRLIRAGDQAHAALHGRSAAREFATRPAPMRWLTWAGVVITFAALPIGLLTPIPSVVLSALGLTMVGAAYLAADRRATTARRPADRLRLLLIFGTWLVLVIAAAASLT